MVSCSHVDAIASLNALKFSAHVSSLYGQNRVVYKVAHDNYNIRIFAIYDIDIACQICARGAIAEMYIAHRNKAQTSSSIGLSVSIVICSTCGVR